MIPLRHLQTTLIFISCVKKPLLPHLVMITLTNVEVCISATSIWPVKQGSHNVLKWSEDILWKLNAATSPQNTPRWTVGDYSSNSHRIQEIVFFTVLLNKVWLASFSWRQTGGRWGCLPTWTDLSEGRGHWNSQAGTLVWWVCWVFPLDSDDVFTNLTYWQHCLSSTTTPACRFACYSRMQTDWEGPTMQWPSV